MSRTHLNNIQKRFSNIAFILVLLLIVITECLANNLQTSDNLMGTSLLRSSSSDESAEKLSSSAPSISASMVLQMGDLAVMEKVNNVVEVSDSAIECHALPAKLLNCSFDCSCIYGMQTDVSCSVTSNETVCSGPRNFTRTFVCQFCFQVPSQFLFCGQRTACSSTRVDQIIVQCTVSDEFMCMGMPAIEMNER
jgi:hypothetical protein